MRLFPTCLLLGLAGMDPTGAVVIITALAMGIKKNKIILFIATVFFGTILLGLIASNFIVDIGVDFISNLFNYIPDYIYMLLEFIIGFILLKWFIDRTFFKEKKESNENKKESIFTRYIKKSLFLVGVLFSALALTDPSFLALITLVGQSDNIVEMILANVAWVIISQLPIFILLIAIVLNKHEKMIEYCKNKIATGKRVTQIKKVMYVILSIIILIASILSITESIYFFITDTWLF